MSGLRNPVEDLLRELNLDEAVLTAEDIRRAEKDINEKLRKFDIEQKGYFARSIESARHAYITF